MPRRGELWWVRLDPFFGSEKDLALRGRIDQHSERTPENGGLSSSPQPGPPLLVPVDCAGRRVVAVIDQIRAVAKERLERCIGELVAGDLEAVEDGLRHILELR